MDAKAKCKANRQAYARYLKNVNNHKQAPKAKTPKKQIPYVQFRNM